MFRVLHTFLLFAVAPTLLLVAITFVPLFSHAQQVRLPVSFHRQEHPLSCEIATLKMALQAHGIKVSEHELISKLPFDRTPKRDGIWGDPNKGFVGNIDGRMLVDGYGVYWDPIANIGNEYAHTTILQHGSAQDLARHISEGNPVIIWGYYGRRAVYTWQTPAGDMIKAVNGQHTRIVYGFDGTVDNPTRFYLIDPLSGHLSWSTDELMHNWSSLNHMGVVVSKHPTWVRVPGDTQVWELSKDGKTRHWVTSWDTFVQRGGSANTISAIDEQKLVQYKEGSPI